MMYKWEPGITMKNFIALLLIGLDSVDPTQKWFHPYQKEYCRGGTYTISTNKMESKRGWTKLHLLLDQRFMDGYTGEREMTGKQNK